MSRNMSQFHVKSFDTGRRRASVVKVIPAAGSLLVYVNIFNIINIMIYFSLCNDQTFINVTNIFVENISMR